MTLLHSILFLFILGFIPIQAFNIQVPFYLDHHKVAERENTLKLKTIYHHASANGPIPKLFRKIDIDNNNFYINQQQEASYTLKSKLAKIDRPLSSNRQELLYNLQQRSNKEEFVRVTDTMTMMESTIDAVPDVTHRPSIMSLAMMTNNAYLDINLNNTEWYDLGEPWHLVKVIGKYM
jgi:lipase ATG15